MANETPGKFDDVLEAAECFSSRMALVFRHAKENYVDPDGTFQDIKLVEFDKWLPIVRYITGEAQSIGEDCFGADMMPDVNNEILKIALQFLGIKTENPAVLNFLSKTPEK